MVIDGDDGSGGSNSRQGAVNVYMKNVTIKQHLDVVLNSLRDHAVLTLDTDGNVTSWNYAAQIIKGYTESEILGKNFSCFYEIEDQQSFLPTRILQLARKTGSHEMQGWRLRKNGERFWANVVIQPLIDDGGSISGFVKITRDISQQLELEKRREDSISSQKREMIGRLTGGIAHDLNNLLTSINASNELIRRISNDQRVNRILDVNTVGMNRSKKLIAQLMAFSGIQIFKAERTHINQIIAVFSELVLSTVGENVNVKWRYGDIDTVILD
ncbi:MAG: hypothetical protein B7Z58_18225 [Acidiphilium sp. 37-64-53]|uniref:PAS domain S-box protein n=1 Tax=Acidiphilium sp. 37-64-53 TaxID=1970299 RepID=UPI000BDC9D1F|nr:PAS domain-containing sensor histidine kinase [Acidiphilium sp. 37-64-53]OYV99644.1 MAG: hypothetical protein B7Z58_18225 [Acidiphilium sp. 37-64-53]HQT82468.1 PAS domain S-box protein [Ferrovaceae bacterium]